MPQIVNQFVGINYTEINQDTNQNAYAKEFLNIFNSIIEDYITKKYIGVNEKGILIDLNSYPDSFETISFKKLIKNYIKANVEYIHKLDKNCVSVLFKEYNIPVCNTVKN